MHFLADMGVDVRVVQWLRDQGHDAVHLRDEGLHRLPIGQIFAKAAHQRRPLLTFDLDFGEIAALIRDQPVTVILFRLHNTRASHIISRREAVLTDSPSAVARHRRERLAGPRVSRAATRVAGAAAVQVNP